jgi:hypothetical protein
MIFLDFLIFYLTAWYTNNNKTSNWSTPVERAVYVLTIVTIFWTISIWELVQFFRYKDITTDIPIFSGTVAGVLIIIFYRYIYVNKERYSKISLYERRLSENNGIIIAIIFSVISIIMPYIIFMTLISSGKS